MRNDFDDYCPASVSRGELEDIASITVRLMPYYGRDIEKMRDMPREQAVAYRQELREKGMFYDAAKAVDIYSHGNFCASHLSNFCKTDFIFEGINIKSMEGFFAITKNFKSRRTDSYMLSRRQRSKKGRSRSCRL